MLAFLIRCSKLLLKQVYVVPCLLLFSPYTLLVGQQEGYSACKKRGNCVHVRCGDFIGARCECVALWPSG